MGLVTLLRHVPGDRTSWSRSAAPVDEGRLRLIRVSLAATWLPASLSAYDLAFLHDPVTITTFGTPPQGQPCAGIPAACRHGS